MGTTDEVVRDDAEVRRLTEQVEELSAKVHAARAFVDRVKAWPDVRCATLAEATAVASERARALDVWLRELDRALGKEAVPTRYHVMW